MISLLALSFVLQVAMAQETVNIHGIIQKDRIGPVKLFKVQEGAIVEIAHNVPNADGLFGFKFYPDYEGLYVLGTGDASGPQENYKFWFKPGDRLALELNNDGYRLTGTDHSRENAVLTDWYGLVREMEWKSIYFMRNRSTYKDFFPVLERTLDVAADWPSGQQTGNTLFDESLLKIMKLDLALYAMNYLQTPRSVHPETSDLPVYYRSLQANQLVSEASMLYAYPWGKRTLSTLLLQEQLASGKRLEGGLDGLRLRLTYLDNDTLRGDIALEYALRLRDYANYLQWKEEFGQYILTESQRALDLEILTPLAALKPGDRGLDFTFENNHGRQISFSDLKGKVVLMDVWATWCGPCIAQFPHLRQLKKDFEGKDLIVLGLSVDADKDKDKWKQMIMDEQLSGVQLFAGPGNVVSKYYKISGIPRFMVFDREGRIVTIDAPRPSNPALKALLDKILNE